MNHKLKKGIRKAFEAPEPDREKKERFLGTLSAPCIRTFQFLLIQAAYVRKRTLLFSVLLLLPAGIGAYGVRPDTLWAVSACVPFLALLAVAESTRSIRYEMDELEMSARFSLKSVVLARMSVLGLADAVIFCCFIPLCGIGSGVSSFRTAVYLFVPYLLTANISLWLTRRFRGKEVLYACLSAAVSVSVADAGLRRIAGFIFQTSCIGWWLILTVLLAAAMIYETRCMIRETEEYAWNL